ncbi:hypothetical protein [Marinovum sp.]|uniref:hypothetical protein n=1 Tax=Marinovum sp. TaxID=2024839 RepID=UPI003A8FB5E6
MSAERFRILAKPAWQTIVGHPVVSSLSLDQLRALDGFFEHLAQYRVTDPQPEDFLAFASLGPGGRALQHLHAGLARFDASDPNLEHVDAALAHILPKENFKGHTGKGRATYTRSVSVSLEELPPSWRQVLQDLDVRRMAGDRSAPAPSILDRMKQKLGQYILVVRREGLPEELHQEGLTAFYADLSSRRSLASGAPLRPATLRATWEELARFARHRGTYPDELMQALRQTFRTLTDEEATTTQLKYEKLHGIGGPPDVIREALKMVETAQTKASPATRHNLRNRAAAFALPAVLPLRREWHRIVFGKTLFFERGRYRLRNYKPGKTSLLDGSRAFPGSIHPMLSRFVDALVLQDNDPRYLKALRSHAETVHRPLFVHPDGTPVARNYVTNVWRDVAGTGAHAARTMMHNHFGARGEEGVRKAMILCQQRSRQSADRYTSASVGEHHLELVSEDLLDEFTSLQACE